MKKNHPLLNALLLALSAVAFASCKKTDRVDVKNICRINQINTITGDQVVPRVFYYDKWDNPTKAEFPSPGTGTANFTFQYDKSRRLSGYTGYSSHKYVYDKYGNAIIDTIHANYVGQDLWFEDKLLYDNQQRIIKSMSKLFQAGDPNEPGLNQTVTTYYKYDVNGNLMIPGVSYDKKLSLFRTNKVWMLIHKNYSVNNALPGPTSYNAIGLPLDPKVVFLDHFSAEVFYGCDQTALPGH